MAKQDDEDEGSGKPATLSKQILVGYKYLLSMPINSLTAEKVIEILKQRDNKKGELDKLVATPIKEIWRADLDEIEKSYEEMREIEKKAIAEEEVIKQGKGKGGKRKRRGKAPPRKRKKKNDSDDDEFIVPSKTRKATKKAPKKKEKKKQPKVTDYLESDEKGTEKEGEEKAAESD